MRSLLDGHTLIWAADDVSQLGPAATAALQDPANELLLSAATLWEIAIKPAPSATRNTKSACSASATPPALARALRARNDKQPLGATGPARRAGPL
jgi:hypothetical protein